MAEVEGALLGAQQEAFTLQQRLRNAKGLVQLTIRREATSMVQPGPPPPPALLPPPPP